MGKLVELDDRLHKKVVRTVKNNPIKYATIQQFVNLAVKEKLER